jgi:hypothetical protein
MDGPREAVAVWYDECTEVELEADEFQMAHDDWRLRFNY